MHTKIAIAKFVVGSTVLLLGHLSRFLIPSVASPSEVSSALSISPFTGLLHPVFLHLVEKSCNGHTLPVNNLVAKWRRSADCLLCLPSPLLSVSSFQVPISNTRGRNEAGFVIFLIQIQQKKEGRKESLGCLDHHMLTKFL